MAGRTSRRGRAVDLARYRSIIPDWDRFVASAARPEPTVFRVRTGRITEAELVGRLEGQGFRVRPVEGLPAFFQVEYGPYAVSMTLEHWSGLIYVQQASTGTAAPALGPRPGERVLDLCSAPGGKTTHLAELMSDRGCLVASEIDERRIRGLLGNVYRLCHPNVMVVACDGRNFPEGALFDRVLVDAPCSGEGTLRRRSGEAPTQSKSFLRHVTRTQRALLEKAVRLVRPGGTVLYATCTFAPEENEAVVSDVLACAPVELEPLDLAVPHCPGLTSFGEASYDERLEGAARIYPYHLDSGGLFLAKLRRLDGDVPTSDPTGGDVPDVGWSRVPVAFPDGEATEDEARERVSEALQVMASRYGIEAEGPQAWSWSVRGERVWLHAAGEWPLEAWDDGAWRPISIGLRAFEFDSRGRPRPTNDFLRYASDRVSDGVTDVTGDQLGNLLSGQPESVEIERRGPIALRFGGHVVGRGAVTSDGLKSEIPRARAADLKRILDLGSGS